MTVAYDVWWLRKKDARKNRSLELGGEGSVDEEDGRRMTRVCECL